MHEPETQTLKPGNPGEPLPAAAAGQPAARPQAAPAPPPPPPVAPPISEATSRWIECWTTVAYLPI